MIAESPCVGVCPLSITTGIDSAQRRETIAVPNRPLAWPVGHACASFRVRRAAPGVMPITRLKVRLKAASDV
jgi:hypothetical protein